VNRETQVLALFEEGNPVPDLDALEPLDIDAAAYLATLEQRSTNVSQTSTRSEKTNDGKRTRTAWLVAAAAVVIIGVGAVVAINQSADDSPAAAGPVTIETELDMGARPVVGTFEVTEGADVLGCSNGTSVDTYNGGTKDVTKVMTCSDGGTGTFTMHVAPETIWGDSDGPWSILSGSADFAGLEGEGEFVIVTDGSPVAFETFTGDIEYSS
jgi:hypothetical protein